MHAARGDASTTTPKQLRKRLRKTEAELAKAAAKRDDAQARVEALAIIADEIRAQLAESEKAAAEVEAAAAQGTVSSHTAPSKERLGIP
jgi:chromosome segregation ATPase